MYEFSVPALSISSSRTKKNQQPPTRMGPSPSPNISLQDQIKPRNKQPIFKNNIGYPNHFDSHYTSTQSHSSSGNLYKQQKIGPPKQNQTITSINRNVYLHADEAPKTIPIRTETQNKPHKNHYLSDSSHRNPQSTQKIEEKPQQQRKNKIDAHQILFDRKIEKMMQQSDFYSKQVDREEIPCAKLLVELQQLKEDSLQQHRKILQRLTALIS